MSRNFFGRLIETQQLILAESSEEREQYSKFRLTALQELKSAVYSCIWCDTEKTRQMMRYIERRSVDVAKLSGVSPNTVRSARSKASKRLYNIFGENVFDGIICGDESICKRTIVLSKALRNGYDRIENFIPDTILRNIENRITCNYEKEYELSEMTEEIKFLKDYNQITMKSRFDSLDSDKLSYLLNLLKPCLLNGEELSANMQKLRILHKIM